MFISQLLNHYCGTFWLLVFVSKFWVEFLVWVRKGCNEIYTWLYKSKISLIDWKNVGARLFGHYMKIPRIHYELLVHLFIMNVQNYVFYLAWGYTISLVLNSMSYSIYTIFLLFLNSWAAAAGIKNFIIITFKTVF